jgi:hypothetical protein
MDSADSTIARFHRRGAGGDPDPWHDQVRQIVAGEGGDQRLVQRHRALEELAARRSRAKIVRSVEGAEDRTYRDLVESLA